MAMFIMRNNIICVKADKLTYENEGVFAWDGDKVSAVFKLSELMGCYLEEAMV